MRTVVVWLLAFVLSVFALPFTSNAAAAEPENRPWHLDAQAQTNFPVDVGARLSLEMPARLRLATSVGGLPGGYVDVINAVVVSAGGYPESTATIVRGALQRSLVWRLHAGWRPLAKRGLYFEAGYGLAALGGGLTGGDVLVLVTGNEAFASSGAHSFSARATVHMLDVEIGWQWQLLRERLVLRAALGYAGTMGAHAEIEPTFNPGLLTPVVDSLTRDSERELEAILRRYVHTPVITLGVGYRFF